MMGQSEPDRPFRLLFVCTGNTCRSPMARALADRVLAERGWEGLEVRSAGLAALPGAPASGGSLRITARHGIDLSSHRSAQVDRDLVDWADLVLTMSPGHLAGIEALGGGDKVALITDFAGGREGGSDPMSDGVSDPIGGDDELYEATFRELSDLVSRAIDRLTAPASS